MQYQVENGSLRELIAGLFTENYSLRQQLTRSEQNGQSASSTRKDTQGWNREWSEITRKFLFFIGPWPAPASFGMAARPSVDPNSSARYASEEAQRAAEAAETYDLIPRKFHPMISRTDSGFVTLVRRKPESVDLTDETHQQFRKKLQAARSNLLATLIVHAGRIFDMPAALFNRSDLSLRASDPGVHRLVRQENGHYGPCARVLFPQHEDNIIMQHMFLSTYLVTVSTAVHSAQSISDIAKDIILDALRPSVAWAHVFW